MPPRKPSPQSLERSALHYLQRYAASEDQLRRVLRRKVDRAARHHEVDAPQAEAWIDELVGRLRRAGYVDDDAYARMRATGLRRRGKSRRAIRQKLAEKGIAKQTAEQALAEADAGDEGDEDPELVAAARYARRRRLGPFREAPKRAERRERDLAALARQGFSFEVARRVIDSPDATDLPTGS